MDWDWDYTSPGQLSISTVVRWESKVIQGKDQRSGSPSHSLMKRGITDLMIENQKLTEEGKKRAR